MPASSDQSVGRYVMGSMNFIGDMDVRPRYHANDTSRDVLDLDPQTIEIEDVRDRAIPASLSAEGYAIFPHQSVVRNFRNPDEVSRVHVPEIRELLLQLSGAADVVVNPNGVLRFGERSADSGVLDNSRPARFVHIDISDTTAREFSNNSAPPGGQCIQRSAHYNVWRVLTPPPQDVPLAVCDSRSVDPGDLVAADAIFDVKDAPEWSFEGLVIKYNPAHRWSYFSNMTPDEVLVFKTNDTDPGAPGKVPHSAFDDPGCPADVPPRVSIEMRAIAYWYE